MTDSRLPVFELRGLRKTDGEGAAAVQALRGVDLPEWCSKRRKTSYGFGAERCFAVVTAGRSSSCRTGEPCYARSLWGFRTIGFGWCWRE